MRKLAFILCAAALMAVPSLAEAGIIIEASVGKGLQVKPTPPLNSDFAGRLAQTNLLIAPGYAIGQMLRAELGVLMDMPGKAAGVKQDFQVRLRPMLVVSPPLLPLYGRLIFGMANVLKKDRVIEYGAALGVGASLFGLGLFAEAGVIPQAADAGTVWIVEGRAGGFFTF